MCTVTWLHRANGFELFCSRDESYLRSTAIAPSVQQIQGLRALAPLDPDGGGTWAGVNEYGLAVALLNAWPARPVSVRGDLPSRGVLVRQMLGCESVMDVVRRIGRTRLTAFAPFTMAVLETGAPAAILAWDGADCTLRLNGDACMPLTSSSTQDERAGQARRALFRRMRRETGISGSAFHRAFHSSHGEDGPSALSPCMHRADAATVSYSHILVTSGRIEYRYSPGSPCCSKLTLTCGMDRTREHHHGLGTHRSRPVYAAG